MGLTESDLDKLCKVLALTNSDKPGEALAAFQSAKRLLLSHGLTFEDVVARYFDDSGMAPQQQIAALKRQKSILKRQNSELSRDLNENRKAVKDLLNQLWDYQEQETQTPKPMEEPSPVEAIEEVYRPNLTA